MQFFLVSSDIILKNHISAAYELIKKRQKDKLKVVILTVVAMKGAIQLPQLGTLFLSLIVKIIVSIGKCFHVK